MCDWLVCKTEHVWRNVWENIATNNSWAVEGGAAGNLLLLSPHQREELPNFPHPVAAKARWKNVLVAWPHSLPAGTKPSAALQVKNTTRLSVPNQPARSAHNSPLRSGLEDLSSLICLPLTSSCLYWPFVSPCKGCLAFPLMKVVWYFGWVGITVWKGW